MITHPKIPPGSSFVANHETCSDWIFSLPMTPILHAVKIVTLAAWLGVASFGGLGMADSGDPESLKQDAKPRDPYENLESIVLTEEFTPRKDPASPTTDAGSMGEAEANETAVPLAGLEALPTPPAIPEVAEVTPLPEIPEPPPPRIKATDGAPALPITPPPGSYSHPQCCQLLTQPDRVITGSPQGKDAAAGKDGNGGRNGETGMSDAKRLGGGRMPAPSYPAEARARGQSGTVVVEFIVGEDGTVVSANAKHPSPWPLLNGRAVSCVRRWKSPP